MALDRIPVEAAAALGLAGVIAGLLIARIRLARPAAEAASRGGARVLSLTAGGFAIGLWSALGQPSVTAALLTALFGWQLLLIAAVDAEHFWLPDRLTFPLAATGLVAAAALETHLLADAVIGAAAGFAALWLLALAYRQLRGREGLGGGDPFLLAAIGAWVGWAGLPGVLLWAGVAGLSVVAGRAAAGRPLSGADRLPFGVFLAIGGWLTWVLGPLGG
ncbi:prepilin peptidase [Brevundimonas viscosa]|uniref:Leader peptidase (Prepilin peptidase) / N-methyltransferase n=1 Tax=Brevundimonas viscosa TaxID=871741 RepID=A0A1I6T6M6_9CAUL|nr:A24 family peptidase [Brevundimonas viscosa]SFS84915.1 leader peptidase (prepilin peptidase) / N-methyltransferase [Brevundimonas viscosa]